MQHNYPLGKARDDALNASASWTMWVPAAQFIASGGSSPTLSGAQGPASQLPAWLLDAASQEALTATATFPPGWSTINIDMWWLNAGAGTGDVRVRADLASYDAGSDVATVIGSTQTTATAGAQNVLVKTRMHTNLAVAAGKLYRLFPIRVAADAADTLANDMAFLGLELSRAS